MRMFVSIITATLLAIAGPALAHIAEGTVTLSAADEVPAPSGVPANAGGTATLTVEEDKTVVYDVTVQNLTGPALFAHIHEAFPGVAGGILFTFTKTSDTTFAGTTTALTDDQLGKLLSGAYYVNVHTTQNLAGEVRGQIFDPACSCLTMTKKDVRSCVNGKIKALEKEQKKSAAIKAFKKAFKKAACGSDATTPKKKTSACCITTEASYLVTGKLCQPVKKETQCKSGTFIADTNCIPNPCSPPASPSGAFVD